MTRDRPTLSDWGQSERDDPAAKEAASLFRGVDFPVPFHQARVWYAIQRSARPPRGMWRVWRPLSAKALALAVVLTTSGGFVVASALPQGWVDRLKQVVLRSPPAVKRQAAKPRRRTQVGTAPTVVSIPTPPLEPTSEETSEDVRPPVRTVVPSSSRPTRVAAVAPPPPSELAREAQVLAPALRWLRSGGDPASALRAVEGYLRRFPNGVLAREARFARVEALVMLHRSEEALRVLETLSLGRGEREVELRLVRAELRARRDCTSALADFRAVLVDSSTHAERALHGKAICETRLGDRPAALRTSREYLARFPGGRYAKEAERRLGE